MVGVFTYADLGFVVFAIICVIVGLSKGIVSQIFGFASFAAAALVAFFVTKPITNAIEPVFGPLYGWVGAEIGYILSLVIVFAVLTLIIKLLLSLIQRMLKSLIDRLHLIKAIDRVLGMVFSLALLYVIFAALIGLLELLPDTFMVETQEVIHKQIYDGKVLSWIFARNPLGDLITSKITGV